MLPVAGDGAERTDHVLRKPTARERLEPSMHADEYLSHVVVRRPVVEHDLRAQFGDATDGLPIDVTHTTSEQTTDQDLPHAHFRSPLAPGIRHTKCRASQRSTCP